MANPFDRCSNVTDLVCEQPSADHLSKGFREYVDHTFIPGYKKLLANLLPSDVVEHTRSVAQEYGVLSGRVSDKPFFVSDEDMGINGAVGNSCALVIPGKRASPLRVIFAHSDIPCLRAIAPHCEMDAESSLYAGNFYFATKAVGGIRAEDWYGRNVVVLGHIYQNGRRRLVKINGLIEQSSAHTDAKDAIKPLRRLRVTTPYRTLDKAFKALGIQDSMDFGRSGLYVFPANSNPHEVGSRLSALGQDDRSCHHAAYTAGLENLTTDNTVAIFSLDHEEIGSIGNSGGWRGFVKKVLRETLRRKYGREFRAADFPDMLNERGFGGLPAICADVDVAFSGAELDEKDEDRIDFRRAAVAGWGFFICADNTPFCRATSPKHVDGLMTLFDGKLPGRRKRDRYQVTWGPHSADSDFSSASMAEVFDGIMPMVDLGVPLISTHHPGSENLNKWDLAWLKEGLAVYITN